MHPQRQSQRSLITTLGAACALSAAFAGCADDGTPAPGSAEAGSSGASAEGGGGSVVSGSDGGSTSAEGGAHDGAGGAGNTSSTPAAGQGGVPGEDPASGGGAPGTGGDGGSASGGFEDLSLLCVYNEDVGDGGAGGAGSGEPSISTAVNPILGQFLVDGAGMTLYTVGRDSPGDCSFAPASDCVTAPCPATWPPFYAGERVLGEGLDDDAFGTYLRPDGSPQTTYYGWPLYYYLNDTGAGMVQGQGKQGLWHAAEVNRALIVAMREPGTTTNYIAAANGRALYVHTLDTLGSASDPPESACSGACAKQHPPFVLDTISVVSSLEPGDFTLFPRGDGQGLQVAYKGAPLYFDVSTKQPGKIADPMPETWGLALK